MYFLLNYNTWTSIYMTYISFFLRLDSWIVGLLIGCFTDLLDCWTVGFLDCWIVVFSHYSHLSSGFLFWVLGFGSGFEFQYFIYYFSLSTFNFQLFFLWFLFSHISHLNTHIYVLASHFLLVTPAFLFLYRTIIMFNNKVNLLNILYLCNTF